MYNYKYVYWNDETQRIRFTGNSTFEGFNEYEFIGHMTRVEFDLLLEILVALYDDDRISLEHFERVFGDIRTFCDKVKGIIEDELK